jgi:tRNA modification GTPase
VGVDAVTDLRMYTEATLDFPEEDIEFLRAGEVERKLATIRAGLDRVLARARTGALLREGLAVVLVGRPNVGKSSLLNALAHEEAAIVTPIPGTTRDTVERVVEIAGIPLTVVDTAGLRDTGDTVERIGIERTWAAVERADLVVLLVDARDATEALHATIAQSWPGCRPNFHASSSTTRPISPASRRMSARRRGGKGRPHVWLSALSGDGIAARARSAHRSRRDGVTEDTYLARERHLVALREAAGHLTGAAAHVAASPPTIELFAEELREAQEALAAITGEFSADDLLGVIFGRFCIGK